MSVSGRETILSYLLKTIAALCRDVAAMHDNHCYFNNEMFVESYEWYLANRAVVLTNAGAANHHRSAVV